VGAIWETFVFKQLRAREQMAGRRNSIFFYRDRVREVDFLVDIGGRLELFEAKWTEIPDLRDTANLAYVRGKVGTEVVLSGAVVAKPTNSYPFDNGFRAIAVTQL